MQQQIAVIGAGVIGLSIARSLALQGAAVTVLEAGRAGCGTSQTSYAWVNSNGKSPEAYHQLNVLGMQAHHQLQAESTSPARWLDETGTLEWASGPARTAELNGRVAALRAVDYPVLPADRLALARATPGLILPDESTPLWLFPSESLVYPPLFIAFLRAEVRRLGATLAEHCEVTGIHEHASGIDLQLKDGTRWQGDYAVSATGRWSRSLVAKLGLELAMVDADQPGEVGCSFLGYTSPAQVLLGCNLITPDINIRPDGGGRLILQVLDQDPLADPTRVPCPDGPVGKQMLARMAKVLRDVEGVQLERIAVGQRARPADGLPALGFVSDRQRLYVAATHSGMTLAPALGPLIAAELLSGTRSPLLADFRPQRLLGKSAEDFAPIVTHHLPAAQ